MAKRGVTLHTSTWAGASRAPRKRREPESAIDVPRGSFLAGRRYVTDNLYIPFGGFYPESWHVERSPWRRNLAKLVARHQERVQRDGGETLAWDVSPIDDINQQQQQMEMINTELGYLLPHAEREEYGKITPEGRFRIWKEAWLLDYLGIAGRYY